MKNELTLINVPFALGSHRRGCDLGPLAVRHAGLHNRVNDLGYAISEVDCFVDRTESSKEINLKNISSVLTTSEHLSKHISDAVGKSHFPLVIGGDHSIALGTIVGLSKHYKNLGVIWYDAHGDLNTQETTPSGNIHGMPLAASLGFGDKRLTELFHGGNFIKPENVVLIGSRDLDSGEIDLIKKLNITYYNMKKIESLGMDNVLKEIRRKFLLNKVDGVHLSFDMDSLDPCVAPGVGTPVKRGISFREAMYSMEVFRSWNMITSAEFVEVNPLYDDKNRTAETCVDLIASFLGE